MGNRLKERTVRQIPIPPMPLSEERWVSQVQKDAAPAAVVHAPTFRIEATDVNSFMLRVFEEL